MANERFPKTMARVELDLPPAVTSPAPSPEGAPRTFRGRLFRKYLLLILVLVGGALLTSGIVSIYFGYQENKAAIGALQSEKAVGAASRIQQYIDRITQQLAYASLPQIDANDLETRRIEFLKLLRQAPEVTDIAQARFGGPRSDRRVAARHGPAQLADRSLAGARVHQREAREAVVQSRLFPQRHGAVHDGFASRRR